jgi:hypothetical protein
MSRKALTVLAVFVLDVPFAKRRRVLSSTGYLSRLKACRWSPLTAFAMRMAVAARGLPPLPEAICDQRTRVIPASFAACACVSPVKWRRCSTQFPKIVRSAVELACSLLLVKPGTVKLYFIFLHDLKQLFRLYPACSKIPSAPLGAENPRHQGRRTFLRAALRSKGDGRANNY